MSAANGGGAAVAAAITLDELEGLIKRLGMLGSAHDGEVLAAARFVCRWLEQHGTDWRALLTPADEVGVSGVVAAQDEEFAALERDALVEQAYQRGFAAGLQTMGQQVKAQAGLGAGPQPQWNINAQAFAQTHPGVTLGGLGGGLGGAQQAAWANLGQQAAAAQAAPGAVPGAGAAGAGNPWTAGTWQAIAWELLERQRAGIPGVFRGSRESQFVADVLTRGFRTLTNAQEVWLRDIAGRSGMSW